MFLELCFCLFAALFKHLTKISRKRNISPTSIGAAQDTQAIPQIQDLRFLGRGHELASVLFELLEIDGAGNWPPRVNHNTWPEALRPYKEIYLELAPLLPTAEPSLDENVNIERRKRFRSLMRSLLSKKINVTQVEQTMKGAGSKDSVDFPRDSYNGFYSCIAVLRHAYRLVAQGLDDKTSSEFEHRWATVPIVKIAQVEKIVEFPRELDVPWPYLQDSFGVTADSGNITANVLHNVDENGQRVYKINEGMPERITSSEDAFFRMFHDIEVLVCVEVSVICCLLLTSS